MSAPAAPSAFDPQPDLTPVPGAVPPRPKKGWSTWSPFAKVMVVLAIVGGSMMFLAFLAAGALGVWIYLPGPQVSSAYAVHGQAGAVLQLHADVDDEGIAAMLALVAHGLEDHQRAEDREKLPPSLRFLADLQGRETKSVLETIWPRDVTVAIVPGEEMRFTAILNPRRLGGLARVASKFWPTDGMQQEVHRGHTIVSDGGMVWTLSGSSVLLANDVEGARAMVDRVADQRAQPAAPELTALAERLAAGSDAHAVATYLPVELPGVAPDAIARAGVGADLVSDDEAVGRLVVVAVPGQEAAVRAGLDAYLTQLIMDARNDGFVVTAPLTEAEGELRVSWRISGLRAAMQRAVAELGEGSAEDEVDPSVDEAYEPPAVPGVDEAADLAEDMADEVGGARAVPPGNEAGNEAATDEAAEDEELE